MQKLFLFGFALSASAVFAADPVGVAVLPGFDFTNVVVNVDGAPGAQVSLVDSANSPVALDAPLVLASAYAYDVRVDGASLASGAFATGSEDAPAVGEWVNSPPPDGDGLFLLDGEVEIDFAVSPSNRVTRTDVTFEIDGYRAAESLDSLDDDAPVTAIAAVTNSAGDPGWRTWNGSWVTLDGPAPRIGMQYALRMLIDFRHAAPRICYLISEDGGETYVVLKHDGDAWLESSASPVDRVSSVKVEGALEMSSVVHRAIDGTATVRYTGEGGEETTGLLADALAATPSDGSGAAITLLTNVTWPEGGPQSGDYLIDKGGYSLANVPDGVGVVVDASDSLEFLCNPNMVRWSSTSTKDMQQARPMKSLYFFNGLIYTSGGNANSNLGPCPIWAVDPVSGVFVDEYDAASDRLDWFAEDSAGRLYTPYIDIREACPEHATFARRGLDGKWQPMQIWPDIKGQYLADEGQNFSVQGYAVHTFDLVAWKGRIFTSGYGLAWGWEGSDEVMSNATTCLTSPHVFVTNTATGENGEVVTNTQCYAHGHRFYSFLPFENDLFCLPQNPDYPPSYDPEVWRFDEATGQFVLEPYKWDEIAPGITDMNNYWRIPGHATSFADRVLYRIDTGTRYVLCSAAVENHRIRVECIDLGDEWPQSIIKLGDRVAVLTSAEPPLLTLAYVLSGKPRPKVGEIWGSKMTVWESSDGLNFRRRLVFRSMIRDFTAFAYHDGCWYFGTGAYRAKRGVMSVSGTVGLEDLPPGDDNTGDIFRLRDPALADLPAVEAEGAVVVQEGGRGVVRFRLSKRPSAAVAAPVRAALGVPALRPDVAEVVFTPENWNEWHEVAFAAEDDRIDIVKPGAIVCGGAGSGCTWGAARVEVENNDFRVAETPPEGLVDLTRPDGDFTVTTHLRTERDWSAAVNVCKKPFNDDTTLADGQQFLHIKSRPGCDIDYDFGEPTVVNAYGIYLFSGKAAMNFEEFSYGPPRMWTFSGSNDGVHWRVLDRRSCETGWMSGEYRYYSFRNRRSYRKYRITFDSDGNTCAAFTRLSHLEYYNVPQPDNTTGLLIRIE